MPVIIDPTPDPGTTLALCAIWLNTASNLADVRSFKYAGGELSANTSGRVEVRQLANRRRLIRRGEVGGATSSESVSFTLEGCDREQVKWLRDRVGVLLCFRDHLGSKFYGVYSEAPQTVTAGKAFIDRISVKLSVNEITFSEAV